MIAPNLPAAPAVAGRPDLPRVAFSESEAARMVGVCSKTLANARRDGRISYRKEGVRVLYTLEDLTAYLESIKHPATATATATPAAPAAGVER